MSHISVVVPTYSSQKVVKRCLEAIRSSDYKDYTLTVVDCGSKDSTLAIAKELADRVITLKGRSKRAQARLEGIKAAKCEIIVNIDSDVVIKPDTLTKISNYFDRNPEIDALTGILSREHPNPNFFSQYKNLYMHYIFKKLPEKVTFLYGSIHAIRMSSISLYEYDEDIKIADDTAIGQRFFTHGKQIAFLRDLEVIHLKKYNFFSFVRNDFQIPFDWAKIFLKYKGWSQVGRYKTGFAHSSKKQLLSLILACVIIFSMFINPFESYWVLGPISLILIWVSLNFSFFYFLIKERGFLFGILAFFITFIDNIVMIIGILSGFIAFFTLKKKICI